MASVGNPRTWIPYMNNKDCSQGFCSLYCPQWCYIVYPPPPPFDYPDDDSSPKLSPLVIAIIGILATAFLLVSYYTIISKYCGPRESARRNNNPDSNSELREVHNLSTTGLDESLIRSITVFKYKKANGDFDGKFTDCSVCLSEFQDGDSVRLLPKCSHAFHAPCIDTWLKSNSTCPLCRSSIFNFNSSALQVPIIPVLNMELPSTSSSENAVIEIGSESETDANRAMRAFSDLGDLEGRHRVIEIGDEAYYDSVRSVSMDHSIQASFSVADVLQMNEEEDDSNGEAGGSSKRSRGESSKSSRYRRRRVLHCVLSPIAMKRSFSSGRFSFGKCDRGRQGVIPG